MFEKNFTANRMVIVSKLLNRAESFRILSLLVKMLLAKKLALFTSKKGICKNSVTRIVAKFPKIFGQIFSFCIFYNIFTSFLCHWKAIDCGMRISLEGNLMSQLNL